MQNPSFGDISHRILWILSCWTVILHGSVPNEKSRQKRIEKVKTCEHQIYDSKWLGGPNDIPNRFCQKKKAQTCAWATIRLQDLRVDVTVFLGWYLTNYQHMQYAMVNMKPSFDTTVFLSLTTWDPSITHQHEGVCLFLHAPATAVCYAKKETQKNITW